MGFKRNNTEKLQQQLEEMNGGGGNRYEDPTEWTLTTDSNDNGSAVIRFLPPGENTGHTVPFMKTYQHGFKSPKTGRWFIEDCPTTIGRDCPICQENSTAWNSGDQETARRRKRRLSYWANILVVKDEANPDAQGKVFKYRFGKKIYEMILAQLKPEFDEEQPVDVTDPFEGANFFLKCEKVGGFKNYDKSKFGPVSAIADGDEAKIDEIAGQLHDLSEFHNADRFKSDEELLREFNRVEGENTYAGGATGGAAQAADQSMPDENSYQSPSAQSTEDGTDDIPWNESDSNESSGDDDLDELLSGL